MDGMQREILGCDDDILLKCKRKKFKFLLCFSSQWQVTV